MPTVAASIDLALEPAAAFDLLVEELAAALARLSIDLEPRPDGRVTEGGAEIGRVVAWEPRRRVALEWRPAPWGPDETTEVELRFEPAGDGTRVTLEHRGWGGPIGEAGELAGWFAGEVAAPLLAATAPARLGDWLTDRVARRPSGRQARATYSDPLYHYPNFRVLLQLLALGADDYLLEVGCGGGAFLREALRSGCRAAAIDHSAEMVRTASEVNREAIADGRVEIVQASADRLPFDDGTFTCATMTGVLGFLPDPVAAFAEIRRVLAEGGRLALLGSDPKWRGTPAAPEPMASRLRFYEDDELEALACEAGFADARVERHDLEQHARESGVPEEHVAFFAGGDPFLVATKGPGA